MLATFKEISDLSDKNNLAEGLVKNLIQKENNEIDSIIESILT